MGEPSYFQNALSNFVTDAACGGAVRHLTDIGYTLDQIVERLDYPAPRAKVQRIMMDYLYENRVLLRQEPSEELFAAKESFVQEQDAFGRRSIRKVVVDQNSQMNLTNASVSSFGSIGRRTASFGADFEASRQQAVLWKESVYDPKRDGKLTELLHRKCGKDGEIYSYISCPFGKMENDQYSQCVRNEQSAQRNFDESGKTGAMCAAAEDRLSCLNNRQRDYLQGIRWDQPVLYHRLNQRMLEIIGKLYEAGVYSGAAFFAVSREKITMPQKGTSAPSQIPTEIYRPSAGIS